MPSLGKEISMSNPAVINPIIYKEVIEEGWCIDEPVCIICDEYLEDCRCN